MLGEIAEYVESRYVPEGAEPLVNISATRLSLQDEPVALIAVQLLDNGVDAQLLLESENSVEFGLCGDPASRCAITGGEPSRERLRMLSRASLELALDTFQYIEGVESLVAFLPPAEGQDPTWPCSSAVKGSPMPSRVRSRRPSPPRCRRRRMRSPSPRSS